jgi:hypothetical protein
MKLEFSGQILEKQSNKKFQENASNGQADGRTGRHEEANSLKLFTHQQMHYLLNLEGLNFTLEFTKNFAPTCFGLRPSSGCLY